MYTLVYVYIWVYICENEFYTVVYIYLKLKVPIYFSYIKARGYNSNVGFPGKSTFNL